MAKSTSHSAPNLQQPIRGALTGFHEKINTPSDGETNEPSSTQQMRQPLKTRGGRVGGGCLSRQSPIATQHSLSVPPTQPKDTIQTSLCPSMVNHDQEPDKQGRLRKRWPRIIPANQEHSVRAEEKRFDDGVDEIALPLLRKQPEKGVAKAVGMFLLPYTDIAYTAIRNDDVELDKLRKQSQCCIVLDETTNGIRIAGLRPASAKDDVKAIILELQKFTKDAIGKVNTSMRLILAEPAPTKGDRPYIQLCPLKTGGTASNCVPELERFAGYERIPVTKTVASAKDNGHWKEESKLIHSKNGKVLEYSIGKTLNRIAVKPGKVEMRALLGAPIITRYTENDEKKPGEPDNRTTEDFWSMIRQDRSRVELGRLGHSAELFQRVLLLPHLFQAFEDGIPCPLEKVQPKYTGIFTFESNRQLLKSNVDLQLTVDTAAAWASSLDEDGCLRIEKRDWSGPTGHSDCRKLEAYVMLLEGGLSWKLEILGEHHERVVPAHYRTFAGSIEAGNPTDIDTPGDTQLMFKFKPIPGMKSFYQRTTWQFYCIDDPDFIFEVARLDRFKPAQGKQDVPLGTKPTDTRWEAIVYNEYWGTQLARLEDNRGACTLEQMFAPQCESDMSVPGVEAFIQKLEKICGGLSRVKPWPAD